MNFTTVQENIFFSVTRIAVRDEDGKESSIGTGFFLTLPIDDSDKHYITLLITNKHVLEDSSSTVSFSLNKKDSNGDVELGNSFNIFLKDYKNLFESHPDKDIDLACLDVSQLAANGVNAYYIPILKEAISKFDEPDLLPGTEIFFLGFPDDRYDEVHNLPLLRKGFIASIPKLPFRAQPEFIIDAMVFPGSSGSPVYAYLNDRLTLLGIISEALITNNAIEGPDTKLTSLKSLTNIGLGVVIRATELLELIEICIQKSASKLKAGTLLGPDSQPSKI